MTAGKRFILLALFMARAIHAAGAEGAVPDLEEIPTAQLIIQYRPGADLSGIHAPDGASRLRALRDRSAAELTYFRAMSGDAHVLLLPAVLPVDQVTAIARRIAELPDVAYAEPDRIVLPALAPDDPEYPGQWHFYEPHGIQAPPAWDITTGSAFVRIAVLDSGITDHVDLAGRWTGGYDFVANAAWANDGDGRDPDPRDPGDGVTGNECYPGSPPRNSSWHGTHVAGIVGAAGNNATGVAGVNWTSQIVPVRVVGKCGGFISDIADGMRWAAGLTVPGVPDNLHPARVLNLSLGGPGVCSDTYQNAINAVNAAGAIVVVAAGNNGANLNFNTYQPANCNGVITVAATDRGGQRAYYSNYGTVVKIAAPGGENIPISQDGILSTSNTGTSSPAADTYRFSQGTSMAAPLVSGVISLMLSLEPALNASEILALLQSTATPFPSGSNCNTTTCGSGIVNAADALAVLNPKCGIECSGGDIGTQCARPACGNDWRCRDCDADGAPDGCIDLITIPEFMSVVLGEELGAVATCRADFNGDGDVNGLDIEKYVAAMLNL